MSEELVDKQRSVFAGQWVKFEVCSAVCQSSPAEQNPAAHRVTCSVAPSYIACFPTSLPIGMFSDHIPEKSLALNSSQGLFLSKKANQK